MGEEQQSGKKNKTKIISSFGYICVFVDDSTTLNFYYSVLVSHSKIFNPICYFTTILLLLLYGDVHPHRWLLSLCDSEFILVEYKFEEFNVQC